MLTDIQRRGAKCSAGCGAKTYRRSGICWACDPAAPRRPKRRGTAVPVGPDPERLPEDYLLACAEELLRRHEARDALLRQLGIRGPA